MGVKESLKKNSALRSIVKRTKNYYEFLMDAKDFSNNYEEVAEQHGDFRYRLMLYIHNLEKGMCREDPRPFGKEKVERIIQILRNAHENELKQFEYQLAIAILKSWLIFYQGKGWPVDKNTSDYILSLMEPSVCAGTELLKKSSVEKAYASDVLFTRRSVREFTDEPLKQEDIDFAIKCFIAAPTACNRQMCKIYQIENPKYKELLSNTILGFGGFDKKTTTLFLITYDVSAFEFYGERSQGYLNVGLTAMNFANGLHARGIGSCFMQWSNKRADDQHIRKVIGLPASERIGVVLGAGYYKEDTIIPQSTRKKPEMVYSVL